MNKILSLVLVLLSGVAFAAAPVVVIDDNWNAIVDGANAGKFGDVIVNNKANAELLVAVNLAVMAKANAVKAERDAALAAKAAAETAKAAAESAKAAADTAKAAETARVAQIIAALKGVAPASLPPEVQAAIQTEAEKKKAALLAQKAALEAELAKAGK